MNELTEEQFENLKIMANAFNQFYRALATNFVHEGYRMEEIAEIMRQALKELGSEDIYFDRCFLASCSRENAVNVPLRLDGINP